MVNPHRHLSHRFWFFLACLSILFNHTPDGYGSPPTPPAPLKYRTSILSGLVFALKDKSVYVREDAIKALGKLQPSSPKVMQVLETYLSDSNNTLRQAAAQALVSFGPQARPIILQALKKGSPSLRALAARSLLSLQPSNPKSTIALRKALFDPFPQVRCNAAHTLGKHHPSSKRPTTTLLKLLRHASVSVQSCALYALGDLYPNSRNIHVAMSQLLQEKGCKACHTMVRALQTPHPSLLPFLKKMLLHTGWENQYYTSQILRSMGQKASTAAPLLLKALQKTNGAIWGEMSQTLVHISGRSPQALKALQKLVSPNDHLALCGLFRSYPYYPKNAQVQKDLQHALRANRKLRQCALSALQALGRKASWALPDLFKLSTQDLSYVSFGRRYKFHHDGEFERMEIATTLSKLGPKVLQHLRQRLQSKNSAHRSFAAQVASMKGRQAASLAPALLQRLNDSDRSVRWYVLRAFQKLQSSTPQALRALRNMLQDKDPFLRHQAFQALLSLKQHQKSVPPWLLQDLRSKQNQIQVSAIKVVALLGFQTIPLLLRRLRSQSPEVRLAVMQAISRSQQLPWSATPVLLRALRDPDLYVRRYAIEVLTKRYQQP